VDRWPVYRYFVKNFTKFGRPRHDCRTTPRCNRFVFNGFREAPVLDLARTRPYTGRTPPGDQAAMRFMPPAPLLFALTVTTAVWGMAPWVDLSAQSSSRERTLFASAVDGDGKPVEGLGPEAFEVREDGVRREILRVSRAIEPIDIALLVDNSTAAADEIMFLRSSLSAFVKKMAIGNHVAVVTLADRPTIRVDYTNDGARLVGAVSGLFSMPQSGMTLLDAITEVSRGLARREASRAVIVPVITDGTEFTNTYHRDVVNELTRAGAALHMVTVGQFYVDNDDRSSRERSFLLDVGPAQTGGQRMTLLSPMGLGLALEKLAAELSSQYKVVYSRPEALIKPSKVTVSSARPTLVVRGTPARGENGG
jgi:VWFA-related protein